MAARRKRGPPTRSVESPASAAGAGVEIRRGDILWICCDPSVGAEPTKTRTCVVVSNDVANRYGQAVTVIPTQRYSAERAARAYMADLRAPRSTLDIERVANASMVMTYDRKRVVQRAGRVGPAAMLQIEEALAMHLGFRGT
jgi:mRNA interferase MazF